MQRRLTAVDHLLMFMPSTSVWQWVALTWQVALACTDNSASFLPCRAGRRTALTWGMGTDTSMNHLLVSSSLFFHRWKGMATDKIRLLLSREIGRRNYEALFPFTSMSLLHWKEEVLPLPPVCPGPAGSYQEVHLSTGSLGFCSRWNAQNHKCGSPVVMQRTHHCRKLAAF